DSGVFIESGSFTSGVQINAINHSDVGTDSDLYEGCSNYFVLERAENSDEEEEVLIYITYAESSTAEEGVDVSEIVDSAYMAPYENYDTIHYTAFNDGIEEGTELMILEFWTECPCGGSGGNSVIDTIEIYDAESIKGGIQDVQTRYCGEEPPESLTLAAEVNINPAYYEWNTGSYSNQIVVNPSPGIETYSVTISDVCGNEVYDSVTIRVSDMNVVDIAEEQVTCYNNCDGGFEIIMEDDTENYQYTYGNADYFYLVDSLTTTTDPVVDGLCPNDYYIKIVDDIDCYIESEVTVPNKPNINLSPGIINSSVNFCEPPGEITLNAEASIDDATFQWFNGEMGPNTTVTPEHGENEYWVEISDLCGTTFTDYVTIRLSEITMDTIILPDTNECSGAIQLIPSGGFEPYNVYWEEPLEDFGLEIEDLCAGDYIFELTDDIGCEYTDTLSVPLSNSIADESAYPVVVYPNPAKNHAFIDLSELPGTASIVNIYSLTGQLINSKRTSDPVYRTPELPAGSYTIEIMTPENKRRYIDKLIITE
ncbi:MAG: T9SS type A sorting domain-containing protein, partial [Bacteroidales bacterium]